MTKILVSLFIILSSSNLLFANYLCRSELTDNVPVVKISYREVAGEEIDFKKGVPEDKILKKTEFNPALFDGTYENLIYESLSFNGKGSVVYFKPIMHKSSFEIVDKCTIPEGQKVCLYPITNVTNGGGPINNFTLIVKSEDKIYDYAELIAGLTAVNTEFGNILLVSTSKNGSFSESGGGDLYKKDVTAEGYVRVTFPKNSQYLQAFVYAKSKEIYDRYVSLEIKCEKK